uniref:Photosystem II protein n=1 Tax=Anthurium amnicola TaxID=1678845 RepID=A0A1D1ZBF0_9ARAE
MASSLFALEKCCRCSLELMEKFPKDLPPRSRADDLRSRSQFSVPSGDDLYGRRHNILHCGASLLSLLSSSRCLVPLTAKAEGDNSKGMDDDEDVDSDKGVVGSIKSLFDPNENTKSGKVLPKAYLKSAREVVKTLRESLEEDSKDVAKFRRSADAAKESIREFLSGWKGQQAVVAEESYVALEKAIRSLANFYSKAGPFASLPEDIKSGILDYLTTAESFL